ncbi:MAG: hypothetical protein M3388_19355 [Acidobacteriota bacterium]|nr:hypothetical protein [Acidobacteriota bacterium]
MNTVFQKIVREILLVGIIALLANPLLIFAHGGEDHGEAKPQTSVTQNVETRTAVADDFEILLKTPLLEPDKEIGGKLFLTSHETNEPITNAKIILLVEGEDGKKIEIIVNPTDKLGVYRLIIPPILESTVKLGAKINHSGKDAVVSFGAAEIKSAPIESSAENTSWARSALLGLGAVGLLTLLGFLAFLLFRNFRQKAQTVEQKTVSV